MQWRLLKKLKTELPYDPTIPLLGIYKLQQRHLHAHVYCSVIHNNKVVKTVKMPTNDEWIKKMWYLHVMKFYSAIKENEILPFAGK
jgi:hypothetical protein